MEDRCSQIIPQIMLSTEKVQCSRLSLEEQTESSKERQRKTVLLVKKQRG